MTRQEAIEKVQAQTNNDWTDRDNADLVDSLIALDILKVEETRDEDRIAAASRLAGAFVLVRGPTIGSEIAAKLTVDGAHEILDVLTKSGFKITR